MKILYERIYELEKQQKESKIMDSKTVRSIELLKHYREILIDLGLCDYYREYRKNREFYDSYLDS